MSTQQVMDALATANHVRSYTAQWRRDTATLSYREGCTVAADAVEHAEPPLDSIRIDHLLMSVQRMGPTKVTGLLRSAGITVPRRLRDTPPRQRELIAECLRMRARGA